MARIDDFLAAIDRLAPGGALGVAVSGGPDSLALLMLAAQARPGRVRAATVDHGLRAGSAAEAVMVASYCADLGVLHDLLPVEVATGASVQAQAREARYAALGSWAREHQLAAVATAHHADDQAETLLMRLARGSGVDGLAGVREQRELVPGVALIRPLLNWRKSELAAICDEAGWHAADDPTNHDARHDRTRVRALLAATPLLDAERLARSASALAEASEALEAMARRERVEAVSQDGDALIYRPSPLREVRRRIAALLIGELMPDARPRGPELDRLLAMLEIGGSATLAGVLVRVEGGRWTFRLAPPRRS
ncbi:tRNA lysidine(34) synthetase TilS [Sphingomonas humi]|uniref:tRNA lysidine(34) synthetase TilS n=1 Tax=Sphingomonas humi TaxID=335630 RepID=UPI0031DD3C06